MSDLTPDLAELRRLAEAATQGPWAARYGVSWEARVCATTGSLADVNSTANAELIAAAVNALPALLDAAAERDALAAKVERVRELHRAVGIYDECECSDEAKTEGHEDVEEVGLTCNRMYTVCAECCRDDVYQTEDCANYHDHKPDEAHHCPTIRALDGGAES